MRSKKIICKTLFAANMSILARDATQQMAFFTSPQVDVVNFGGVANFAGWYVVNRCKPDGLPPHNAFHPTKFPHVECLSVIDDTP